MFLSKESTESIFYIRILLNVELCLKNQVLGVSHSLQIVFYGHFLASKIETFNKSIEPTPQPGTKNSENS
jgi:hypothetical protein